MTCDPILLATPGVRTLVPYEPGKPLEELERELGIKDAVKLASNENPYGPSPAALAAIAGTMGAAARYPDGGGFALKRALARHLDLEPARITLGNGSNDVLELIARTFLAPGEMALCDAYAFAVYPIVVRAAGAQMITIPSRDFAHDMEAMAAALSPAVRIVFLANPNNPTGTSFGQAALARFLAACPATTLVVLDEAYCEYVDDPDYPDSRSLLHRHDNLIVVRTFSKAYGLAGLRVGYGLSSAALAGLMNRVRQPFNVSTAAQAAAVAALADQDYMRMVVARSNEAREAMRAQLAARGLPVLPSAGNFLCVEVGDGGAFYQALLRRGVIVRPLGPYGMSRHIRVTMGTPAENDRFLQALDAVTQALHGT
ncbi:MAG: histidinol-phosphate transaminase [Gammaproteobacteria bacterium]|nr:histidinol-phosphate transaminase [Gammaproteobacteria bacterium]